MKIGDYLIVLALALVSVIILVGLFRGEPMLFATPPQDPVLLFALSSPSRLFPWRCRRCCR